MNRAIVFTSCALLASAGCKPSECGDDVLAQAAKVDAASEGKYARDVVIAAVEATQRARDAVAAQTARFAPTRSYGDAKALCQEAVTRTEAAAAAVESAKKKSALDAVMAKNNTSLDDAGIALMTARAILAVAPQPEHDEALRTLNNAHRAVGLQVQEALASSTADGGVAGDLAPLEAQRAAAEETAAKVMAAVLQIRRGAEEKCKPMLDGAPLFFGGRARAHDGFGVVEAGTSAANTTGTTVVIERTPTGCRMLSAKPAGDPAAIPLLPAVQLGTWAIDGASPVRLLFAWNETRAWFVGEQGSFAFDAAAVTGFAGVCGAVTCTKPEPKGVDISARCTCHSPTEPRPAEMTRDVRFAWRGNAVVAER